MYWGYHRCAWTKPFESLSDHFEFIYIFHYNETREIAKRSNLDVRYFSEFKSIGHLLDEINPQKLVFIGLDSVLSSLINAAAKSRNIETLLIQHGFLLKLQDQILEYNQEQKEKVLDQNSEVPERAAQSDVKYDRQFMLSSLNLGNALFFVRLIWNRYRYKDKSDHERLAHLRAKKRLADRYILFSPYFCDVYVKRDGVQHQIEFIGNIEADEVVKEALEFRTNSESPYLLHVDQPILHSYKKGNKAKYSMKEGQEFYLKLGESAAKVGMRLVIKLHPYSFDFIDLYPKSANIEYVKEHQSLPKLIQESSLVTGFYSTLLLPALRLKPTVIFEFVEGLQFIKDLKSIYHTTVVSMAASAQELAVALEQAKLQQSDKFIRDFFYKADGLALDRLKQALTAKK